MHPAHRYDDSVPAPALTYRECPRCGDHGFERLASYSHCVNCFYICDRFEAPLSIASALEAERALAQGDRRNNVQQLRLSAEDPAHSTPNRKAASL